MRSCECYNCGRFVEKSIQFVDVFAGSPASSTFPDSRYDESVH